MMSSTWFVPRSTHDPIVPFPEHCCYDSWLLPLPPNTLFFGAVSNKQQQQLPLFKMARWFRSEPMKYISLIVNVDAAHNCLADLGKMGVIQFTDVSSVTSNNHFEIPR